MIEVRKAIQVALAIALAAISGGRSYAAAPTEEDLIKEGLELRKSNNDEGALDVFRRAYELAHSPRAAGQLGLAELAMGRWADAEAHLEMALAVPSDPWVAKNRATLDETLARIKSKLGDVDIVGGPAGAEIVIEGEVRGSIPLAKPLRVRIGERRVELRAPGHAPASVVVSVTSEHLTRERLVLSPAPIAAPATVAAGPTSPAVVQAGPVTRTRPWTRTAAWTAGAGAIVGLAAGAALHLDTGHKFSDFDRSCVIDPDTDKPVRDPQGVGPADVNCTNLYESWTASKRWTVVGYAVGGALAAASVIFFVMSSGESSAVATRTAYLTCRPSFGAVVCGGVF